MLKPPKLKTLESNRLKYDSASINSLLPRQLTRLYINSISRMKLNQENSIIHLEVKSDDKHK